jgi:uncharacterized protein YndB with AHSA1/START domain
MPNLQKSQTLSVSIDNEPAAVFAYVTDPWNLPQWAPGLALRVAPPTDGSDEWTVETGDGPVGLRFVPDNPFGVADHVVRLPDGVEVLNPMRVLPNGAGTEVTFTLFRQPGMTDDEFARDRGAVESDLDRLGRLLRR